MSTFLEYFNLGLVVNVVVAATVLIFSQKIKDFINGVPAHSRAAISQLEAQVLTKVKAFEQELVAKIMPVTVAVTAPVAAPVVDPPKAV